MGKLYLDQEILEKLQSLHAKISEKTSSYQYEKEEEKYGWTCSWCSHTCSSRCADNCSGTCRGTMSK